MRPKLYSLLLSVSLIVSLSGCYTARVGTHIQGDPVAAGQTVHFFLWGALQSPKQITTPICDSLGSGGMAEVSVKNNFGYSLITVITLGIWSPTRLEWKCSKPCPKEGVK